MNKKLIYLISEDWFFCSHFMERAIAARNAGFDVTVVTREQGHGAKIRAAGLKLVPVAFERRNMNPLVEMRLLLNIYRIYSAERPDLVHHIAAKPIFYGTLIARLMGIKPVVNAPVGMGYAFSSSDIRAHIVRPMIQLAYRMLLNPAGSRAIFENGHDLRQFVKSGAVRSDDAALIRGAGINLMEFQPQPPPSTMPVVMLIARMLRDKGVREFVAAAQKLSTAGVQARFVLVGNPDDGNPASIPLETLKSWNGNHGVEWWGWRDDIANVLRLAHIVCLPSYREGLPKSLLEAAACGLPIVTTDAVGCRDVVDDGVNGYCVPVKNSELLAGALRKLIEDAELRRTMGMAGRKRAEQEFSTEKVVAETLSVYRQLTAAR